MIDKSLIKEKFKNITDYLSEIEEVLKDNDKTITRDFRSLKTLERNFQLIVDEILDINVHFMRELELKTANDFQSTFLILAENNILPENFAKQIAPVVGLRNALVHRYEKIEKDFFVQQIRKEYPDFVQYIKYINNFIK